MYTKYDIIVYFCFVFSTAEMVWVLSGMCDCHYLARSDAALRCREKCVLQRESETGLLPDSIFR